MPNFDVNAKTRVFIGGVIADKMEDFVASDFASQSWTQIKGLTNIGQLGDTYQEISVDQVGSGRTMKAKGTANAGNQELQMSFLPADAGQLALIAAGKARENYAFKIEFDDAPSGGTPTTRMYIALVMGTPEILGGANDVKSMTATLAVNSNIVNTAAAPSGG